MSTEPKNKFILQRSIVNAVTLLRLIALVVLFIHPDPVLILIVSIGVGLSDYLDGYLARTWQCATNFGKNLDQWVDKIVAIAFLFFYYQLQAISLWFIVLFIFREVFVVLARSMNLLATNSNIYGKIKTFLFYVFIAFLSCKNYNSAFCANAYPTMVLLGEGLILFYSYIAVISVIQKKAQDKIVYLIGSSFGTAYLIKKMPGTISSLAAFLILFYFSATAIEIKLAVTLLFILAHFFVYPFFEQLYQKEDVSYYTIDETIAVLLFWMLPIQGILLWSFGFVLFRFFDIVKPLGIKKIETTVKLTKSMRIVADDVLAMLYTLLITYVIKEFI
ncbi:MAG: phosphatidylglycerophosphatase A [Bacteroidetes bacterium]|nr:phosphatidylglycerophosphatase A [Bacteroidota bacterium]